MRLCLVAMLLLLPCGRAMANCYVLKNDTVFPQGGRLVYSAPINQGPVSFSIPAHGQYSDCFDATGYGAMVEFNLGAFRLFHNGQPWTAPLVFGDGSSWNVSPAGTYSLQPLPKQGARPAAPLQTSNQGTAALRQNSRQLGQSVTKEADFYNVPRLNWLDLHFIYSASPNATLMPITIIPGTAPIHKSQPCLGNFEDEYRYQLDLDSTGKGLLQSWSCATQALMMVRHYVNWTPDGPFRWAMIGAVGSVRGQFHNGVPVGKWVYSVGSSQVVDDLKDGTGRWFVPNIVFVGNNQYCGPGYLELEQGYFLNGERNGPWLDQSCGIKGAGTQYAEKVSYLHGKLNGSVITYDDGDGHVTSLVSFENGAVKGNFFLTLPSGGIHVAGEIEQTGASGGWNEVRNALRIFVLGGDPSAMRGYKIYGTWRFSSSSGMTIGTSALGDGSGHLLVLEWDGSPIGEGNTVNGLADGTWSFRGGSILDPMCTAAVFKAGQIVGQPKDICLQ